jgi:hypothetical protein
MRSRSLVLLLACLVGSLAGQNDTWHRYRNDGGNFSVLMPVDPKESSTTAQGDVPSSHTIQAITDGVGYTVIYVAHSEEQKVDEATFRVYRDSFMKGLPSCEQVTESAASPAAPGYVGQWYRMTCVVSGKKMVFMGNLYWGKRYAYAVMVIFGAAASDPPSATKFTGSFTPGAS